MLILSKFLLRALLWVGVSLVIGACAGVTISTPNKDVSYAVKDLESTPLGQMSQALGKDKDKASGFLLLDRGHDALAWRAFMAENAVRTIDAQYFLWKNDRAGKIMIQRLMDAADRGVRVRVIVDDSMTESDPQYLAKFSAYPNIEVRLYKPFGPKHNSYVLRWIDFAADFARLNRRMHNKLFIADDSFIIAGGRNIGEDYFEYVAPDVFRSRDLMGVGPIADSASDAFDLFWNSSWTVPVEQVVAPVPTESDARKLRDDLDKFATEPSSYPPGFGSIGTTDTAIDLLTEKLAWAESRLIYDTVPGENGEPAAPKNQTDTVGDTLQGILKASSDEILIESAYLVMDDAAFNLLQAAKDLNLRVRMLTNSLATNNHVSAFVGYGNQRKAIIQASDELYEYRPDAKSQASLYTDLASGQPLPKFALHAKTCVFDRKVVFIGSFNLDPRSRNLNTEIGLLVESEVLGKAVAESILEDMTAGNSWLVRLDDRGKTQWVTIGDGVEEVEADNEPMASNARKIEAKLMAPVSPDSQL